MYSHVFSLAFEIKSGHPDGEDVTPQEIRIALFKRLAGLDDHELREAIGAPDESQPVQTT